MKRLKKVSSNETEDVKKLLRRIGEASESLRDIYYVLFDNLNALFESYPNLYKQIEMVVKLPENEDAKDIVQFDKDLREILSHLEDEQYLDNYINGPVEDEKEEDQ